MNDSCRAPSVVPYSPLSCRVGQASEHMKAGEDNVFQLNEYGEGDTKEQAPVNAHKQAAQEHYQPNKPVLLADLQQQHANKPLVCHAYFNNTKAAMQAGS